MNKITRRRIVSGVAAVAVLALSFVVARSFSALDKAPEQKVAQKPVKEIDVMVARNKSVPTQLTIDGELVAYDKIDIFAEVSGTLLATSRPFKVGSYFPKGSVLIQVDQEEAKLSLLAQKSTLLNAITQVMPDLKIDYPESYEHWKTYLDSFEMESSIRAFPEPVNEQEKYFIAARNLHTQYFNIKSAEERLKKYTLYAPFSGVITESSINPGAVVRAGQKLGELMNTYHYELEVTVPISDLKYIKNGSKVKLQSDDLEESWTGAVNRIDNQVDPATQTVKVFVDVKGNRLKEGMYMRGELEGNSIENALELPRELLVNQQSVYVLKDSVLSLREVDLIKITEDDVIVQGIDDGMLLLKEMTPGLFDGIKVKIGEKVNANQTLTESIQPPTTEK